MIQRARPIALAAVSIAFAVLTAVVAGQEAPPPTEPQAPAAASAKPEAKPATAQAPEAPQYSRRGADTCIVCHDDEHVLAIFKTPHARPTDPRTPFGHGQLQCEACHGPGGGHTGRVREGQTRTPVPIFAKASTATVEQQNDACLGCHSNNAHVHDQWAGSAHEREGLACVSCHKMHEARDPVLVKATQAETCMGCHPRQRSDSFLPYAHPVRQERMTCSNCHNPHGAVADFALLGRTLNDTCFACHAEKRGPYLWEHAPVTEDCTICHAPHGSSNPGLLAQRAPLLCEQCHSEAGHPSVPVSPGRLPTGMPSAQVVGRSCVSCHTQIHGSNHPSGAALMR